MKIRRLTIENYRQYQNLMLDLSSHSSDVAVIVGSNGTGKTNLLNAIIWCLYGREDYYGRDQESSPLVNQKTVDEAEDGDLLTVTVVLDLVFETGVEAQVTRRQDFRKSGKTTTIGPIELKVSQLTDEAKGFTPIGNAEHWIERWVPSRLEPYFLFDGERLDNFFRHAEAKKVQDAVLQIAQIDLLGLLIRHLGTVANELYSKAGKQTGHGEAKELAEKLDDRKQRLDKALAEVDKQSTAVTRCEDAVRKLEAKIGNIGVVMADIKRRQELEASLSTIENSVNDAWGELDAWAIRCAPSVLAYTAMRELEGVIEEARRKRTLPPPVSPKILEGLLDNAECVCGASLADGSGGRQAILALLEEYSRVNALGEAYLGIEGGLKSAIARVAGSQEAAASHMRRIDDWERRQSAASEELEVLNAALAGHEDTQVQEIDSQLTTAKEDLVEANKDLLRKEFCVEQFEKEIEQIERDLDRLAGKEKKTETLMKQAQFARVCLREAQKMYGQLTDAVRVKVAKTLETQFLRMIWKREGIASVDIDGEYKVSVRNRRGFEILPDLSAGERECLALAFSLALSEVSGYELPMVIDTPMGRLNPDVQGYMARVLCESTKDGAHSHQVVMLMTETEYNDEVADILRSRMPKVFRLECDELESVTAIAEVK